MKFLTIKFMAVIALLGMTTVLTAEDKKMTFALVTHEIGSGFFAKHMRAAEEFEERYGVEVLFLAPEQWNVAEHVNILENVLSRDIDGLATTVVDPNAYRDVVDRALAKGIPVVSFNNDDPNGSARQAYIGQFDYAAGVTAAEELIKTMGGKDTAAGQKVLLFMCCPGFAALEIRADGIEDTLKAAGVNVVGPIEYTADPSKVYGNVEAAFMANQDAKAMISVDAFTSVMGTFVKNNNLLKSGQLSAAGGWDFLPKTVQHIEDGNLNFSIGSNAYITGYYALTSLYLAATNNIPPIDIDTGASLANSSNIKAIRAMTEGELD